MPKNCPKYCIHNSTFIYHKLYLALKEIEPTINTLTRVLYYGYDQKRYRICIELADRIRNGYYNTHYGCNTQGDLKHEKAVQLLHKILGIESKR